MLNRECSILRSIHSSTNSFNRLWVTIWLRTVSQLLPEDFDELLRGEPVA